MSLEIYTKTCPNVRVETYAMYIKHASMLHVFVTELLLHENIYLLLVTYFIQQYSDTGGRL